MLIYHSASQVARLRCDGSRVRDFHLATNTPWQDRDVMGLKSVKTYLKNHMTALSTVQRGNKMYFSENLNYIQWKNKVAMSIKSNLGPKCLVFGRMLCCFTGQG